jgi:hypothetical protein
LVTEKSHSWHYWFRLPRPRQIWSSSTSLSERGEDVSCLAIQPEGPIAYYEWPDTFRLVNDLGAIVAFRLLHHEPSPPAEGVTMCTLYSLVACCSFRASALYAFETAYLIQWSTAPVCVTECWSSRSCVRVFWWSNR